MAKQMYSWMNPKIEIRETIKYGNARTARKSGRTKVYREIAISNKGIFAKANINKGEILIVLGGYILTIEDDNELQGVLADKPIEISDIFFVGPRKPSDLDRMPQHYVNHSCSPNAGFKSSIFVVAMKNIGRGVEITCDYAMVMNSHPASNTYLTMQCKCGAKNCRGMITEDDWKLPELQKRYDGYFSWFLQEKINRLKQKRTR
jgi:uncharacterized protein